MPHAGARAWTRIGASILLLATALAGSFVASDGAEAVPPMSVNCSTLVGSVSTDDSFNAAVAQVNLGACNAIYIANGIRLASPKSIDGNRVSALTITGNPDDSILTSAPSQWISIQTTDDTNLTLTITNLTFSGFDDSSGAWAALTAESAADLTVQLTNVSFIDNFGNGVPGGADLRAGGTAQVSINGYSTFRGNRSRFGSGGALAVDAGLASTVTIGAPGDDSVRFTSNTSLAGDGGAIAVMGATGATHQLTTHGANFEDDSASGTGGAISTKGSVSLNDTDFAGNTASGNGGGAVYAEGSITVNGGTFDGNDAPRSPPASGAVGGALWSEGPLNSQDATYTGNTAGGDGGAIYSSFTVTSTEDTMTANYALAQGGAIRSIGPLSATRSLFRDDSAGDSGGAIYTNTGASLINTTFTNNTAAGSEGGAVRASGGVAITGGTFHGNRVTAANGAGGAVLVHSGLSINQITNATFSNNSARGHGGAVRTQGLLTVTGSTFSDDSAGASGGAIAADDTVSVTSTLFHDDTAAESGGAIISIYASVLSQQSTYSGGTSGDNGGAISAGLGGMTSTQDTFIGNRATRYDGGAIAAGQVTTTGSTFTSNRAGRNGGAVGATSVDDSGSTFTGNRAVDRGGAVDASSASTFMNSTFQDDSATQGGAIYSFGPLTLTNSLFEDDTAATLGGAIVAYDTLSVNSSTFRRNVALETGGAIFVDDTTTVVNSLFQSNEAQGPSPGSNGAGGAIFSSGFTTVTGSTFATNRSEQEGGALSVSEPLVLTDDTFTSNVSVNQAGGAVNVAAPGTITVTSSAFTSNAGGSDGGAIRVDGPATVTSSTFTANSTTTGGKNGGAVSATGDVLLAESEFASNRSTQWGGAVHTAGSATVTDSTFDGNTTQGRGGALYIDDTGTIVRSTFTDDTSLDNGGAITVTDLVMQSSSLAGNESGYGGAVHAWRSASITNSTFEDNYGSWGGAISLANSSVPSRIAYSTLLNNRAYVAGAISQGSAITATATTPIALTGSVLAGAGSLCADDTTGLRDLNLTADSAYSFATDTSCSGGVPGNADDSINTSYTTDDSLGLTASLTTDDTPGMQVVIPDDTSVVNTYVLISVLPGVTTDQLGALRNSPNGLTSGGAVQVRPISVTNPTSITVAAGSNATFSVTGYPGIGPAITYQWQRSTDGTTWSTIVGAQTATLTLPNVPQSDSGLQVRVLVADAYGNDDTSAVATLTVSAPAPPPNPDPGTPPSAPRDPRATAGDARATVTWIASAQSGSFPVTSYEVRSDVDSATCLVTVTSATPLECTVAGLTNDVAYRFSVRALNAAGWGPWSTWSAAVTPEARDSIMITGSRQGRDAVVTGTTQGLNGEQVRAMVRFPGQTSFTAGSRRPVDDKGRFTWQRSTGKKVSVYFTHGQTASNRVSIPARRT